jgi:hypothetical protein
MAREFTEIAKIDRRIRDLTTWLEENDPNCGTEQKHLSEGSQERVYWHYGYMVALRDALRLLAGRESSSSGARGTADNSSLNSLV